MFNRWKKITKRFGNKVERNYLFEKNDYLALVIAAIITILIPVMLVVIAVYTLIYLLFT